VCNLNGIKKVPFPCPISVAIFDSQGRERERREKEEGKKRGGILQIFRRPAGAPPKKHYNHDIKTQFLLRGFLLPLTARATRGGGDGARRTAAAAAGEIALFGLCQQVQCTPFFRHVSCVVAPMNRLKHIKHRQFGGNGIHHGNAAPGRSCGAFYTRANLYGPVCIGFQKVVFKLDVKVLFSDGFGQAPRKLTPATARRAT
jgi:hypothetical protein